MSVLGGHFFLRGGHFVDQCAFFQNSFFIVKMSRVVFQCWKWENGYSLLLKSKVSSGILCEMVSDDFQSEKHSTKLASEGTCYELQKM